jgi:hypothetical protein
LNINKKKWLKIENIKDYLLNEVGAPTQVLEMSAVEGVPIPFKLQLRIKGMLYPNSALTALNQTTLRVTTP